MIFDSSNSQRWGRSVSYPSDFLKGQGEHFDT